MPRIQYKEMNFHKRTLQIIAVANKICTEYMQNGYTLTLRQLYYQFVARGLLDNNMKEYKNLGNIINDARVAGYIDWDAIEDRTRNLSRLRTWDSPKSILEEDAKIFRYDFWEHQSFRIEVWVEKEALIGVIERAAYRFRCPYFACKGYASQSEVWRAGQRFKEYNDNGQAVKLIHLGDHDPSGIDMTRDNDDRLTMFSENGDVEVIRIALNENQVRQYNPPPNPAKLTDTRAADYIARFGRESWELDALEPQVIDNLISTNIRSYIDMDAWNEWKAKEDKAKEKLSELAENWKD